MKRVVLLALAFAAALGSEARAACPSTEGCPIAPQTGVQPCNADLAAMMERAAKNQLGAQGPDYGTIGQGCANTVSVTPSIPCTLTKAISYAESTWRQFCATTCGQSGRTVISFDCGYGLTQVTSGMSGGAGFEPLRVAQDPVYNLGSGMKILCGKWRATPCVGDNRPSILEHWYFATWAYNSFSWRNNPNNPDYPASRPPYNGPGSLSRGNYTYPEIVWGFIGYPPASGGAPLWPAIPVSYPNRSEICATEGCRPDAISEPRPTHVDPCGADLPDDGALESEEPADPIELAAGSGVTKRWRLKNTGQRTWTAAGGYGFVRVSPESLGAPARVELAGGFGPNAVAELSVGLTAPASGSTRVVFQLQRDGTAVGPDLDAVVNVPAPQDADGDGHRSTAFGGDDCDDTNAQIYPGAQELCDGQDQDCDGQIDEQLSRACESACGAGTETCADGTWGECSAPAPSTETCNGADDDCDGEVDEGELCAAGEDCIEGRCVTDPIVYPPDGGAVETPDSGSTGPMVTVHGGCGCSTGAEGAVTGVLVALLAFARNRRASARGSNRV